jgi:uncharacterized glyoxalase superfamily protein PhnB
MADGEMWEAPDIVPSINYVNLSLAIEWLERVFGFRERADARLTWAGGGMAWFEVGNSLLHISTPEDSLRQSTDGAMPDFKLKVYVDDVDAHFARAKAEGAKIILAPHDGFWGGRIYRALDHEGHQWEISQRGRDLAAHRWQLPPGVTRGVPE